MNIPPKHLISIDPGGEHVGWARFEDGKLEIVCERTPNEAEEILWEWAEHLPLLERTRDSLLVIEDFRLYPDKAKSLIGSGMPTSQLIGSLRFIARFYDIPVVLQPAAIKVPTEFQMKRRGIVHAAVQRKQGGHAKDAETHGYHHLIRNKMI